MKKILSFFLCAFMITLGAVSVNASINIISNEEITSVYSDLYEAFRIHCYSSENFEIYGRHTISKNLEIINDIENASNEAEKTELFKTMIHHMCSQHLSPGYVYKAYELSLKENDNNNWYLPGDWSNFVDKRQKLGNLINSYSDSLSDDYSLQEEAELSEGFYDMLYAYNVMCSRYQKVGDADGNGTVNINDATLIQKHLSGLYHLTSGQKMLCAQSAEYEKLDISSATNIQKSVVLINSFTFPNDIFIDENNAAESYDRRLHRTFNFNICPRTYGNSSGKLENNFYDTKYLESVYYKNHRQSITELDDAYISQKNIPPQYWIDAIDKISEKVNSEKGSSPSDTFQFLWMSDLHGTDSYKNNNQAGESITSNLGKTASYIAEKFNLPFVAVSGDLVPYNEYENVSDMFKDFDAAFDLLSPIDNDKLLVCKGNHDGAWDKSFVKNIGTKEIYNQIYKRQQTDKRRVFGKDGTYFYVDTPTKFRLIMLNCHTNGDDSTDSQGNANYNSFDNSFFGTEQLRWLSDVALNMPEGYTAVIMAHTPINYCPDGILLAQIISAYNYRTSFKGSRTVNNIPTWGANATDKSYQTVSADVDFEDAKGEVIAYFCGHIHKDSDFTKGYGIPCISITTAGYDVRDENPVTRVPNSSTESAIDIVTIDRKSRTIYTTRLGAGFDRKIPY